MADVQLEHGYLKLANTLVEALAYSSMNATQIKIVLCLIRLTYGWRRRTIRISITSMADRCNIAYTGGYRKSFRELVVEGVIIEVEQASGRTPAVYAINKDFENWGTLSVPEKALERLFRERPAIRKSAPVPRDVIKPSNISGAFVYYARSGKHVKIGFSQDPWARVGALRTVRPDVELTAVEPGDRSTERDRHQHFAAWRIADKREWFLWCPEIEKHVVGLPSPERTNGDGKTLSSNGHSVAPVGTGDRLQEGIVTTPNPLNSNENGRPKEQNTVGIHRSKKTLTATDDAVDQSKFALPLVSAMNAAISNRWGEQINPLSFGQCTQLAADLIQEGFTDLDISRAAIETACTASRQPSPPAHPNYFRNVIREAHQRAQQMAFDDSQPRKRNGSSAPSPISHLVDPAAHAREMELEREWNRERRLAAIEWGKDPINAARYHDIVEDANVKIKVDPKVSWTASARDEEIVQQCINAIDFPSFNVWRTERDRTSGDVVNVPRGTVETRG